MDSGKSTSYIIEHLEKAEQLKLNGEHEAALEVLERLLLEDPENVSALEEIADNELSLERYGRAETAAKQAIDFDARSYTAHYILGFIHSQKENWKEALSHLQQANKVKSNNAEILRCLGWALFNCERRAQGIVTLERSVNLDEDNALTLCDLGVAYLHVNNLPKAKTLFNRALDLDPGCVRAHECVQVVARLETTVD